ncbi:MAG: glycosyltransferase family 2 protein [Solirubrobacterales bacterium]
MSSSPSVTIAMRTFERPLLLRRAIDSVLAQTFEDWELVIVNNGGDPAPVDEVVAERAPQLRGRERVIHLPEGLRVGAAADLAYRSSDGELLALIDDDDTWESAYLERTVGHLRTAPAEVGGVTTRVWRAFERIAADGTIETLRVEDFNPNLEHVNFQSAFISHPLASNAFLLRRSAYERVGGYDEGLRTGEDAFMILRLLSVTRIDVVREELATRHEREPDSATHRNTIADKLLIRDGDARYRDFFIEKNMREGDLAPAEVAAAISVVDRENHARINESLDHVRELRLLGGDIAHQEAVDREFLEGYDDGFRALKFVLAPIALLRSLGGRVMRRGAANG